MRTSKTPILGFGLGLLTLTPYFVHALFETTYKSSSIANQPLTILSRSASYDADNSTLFLLCPGGTSLVQPGPAIYTSAGDLVWANPLLGSCMNINLQMFDGEQYITLWVGSGTAEDAQQEGHGTGLMLNTRYENVRNVSAVNGDQGTDLHKFNIVKPQNKTALVTAFNPVPANLTSVGGPADGWYLNSIIQEIDIASGKLLFNWTSIDHIAFSESYNNITSVGEGTSSDNPWDAVHINSIEKDTAGDYLLSARHSQALYKIDGASGSIVWRLGGKTSDFTRLGNVNDTQFHWQHHARWRSGGSQISLFDDGAAVLLDTFTIDEPVATGLLLDVDQEKMTVGLARRYIPSPNPALAAGSFEQYGSTVLIGYGALPWLTAHDLSTGTVLYSATIGPNNASLWLGGIENYRAFQTSTHEFVGRPTQPPAVFLDLSSSEVYVSWNGATHVAAWRLLTGNSTSNVNEVVRTVPKAGFETAFSGAGCSEYVRVAGIAANGTTLGVSKVYKTSDGSVVA
ncbi:ASST-domain-containing protein [Mycena amicta]|nr:ASST-domain-containing protein [Mycena amicta]